MISTRLISATLAASLCLSMVPSAFARTQTSNQTSDEIIAEQQDMDINAVCEGRTGRGLGSCIGDAIKRLKTMKKLLEDALERERAAWYDAHADLGVSTEYNVALQTYTKEVQIKRKAFALKQRELEKLFFDKQKEVRTTPTEGSAGRGYSRPVTQEDLDAGNAKCSKIKDDRAKRICLRQQLRLNDPTARQRGAAQRPTGTESR